MYRYLLAAAPIALVAAPTQAEDKVLFGAPPAWVADVDFESAAQAGEELALYDRQVRLENGVVTRYADVAFEALNAQAVQKLATLQFGWMPDKGDLTIHRLEIIRQGRVIDLLADGLEPEVIRRERDLEKAQVDGMLTAVYRVPGLAVGDILRFTHSTTMKDQALGEEMQANETLVAEPAELGFGRVRMSWPDDAGLHFSTMGQIELREPELVDGYRLVEVEFPVAEPEEMPSDAPARFAVPAMIQVSSFENWADVSAVMAPHYRTQGTIEPGGSLAREVDRIEAATSDPLERAALALRVVQDEVSYLMNGMDGGNYLPQSPQMTWQVKYGDCKAKTLLLLAMLREMGIEAEAMLVNASKGDTVSVSQPQPGAFDHVVVRAVIAGTEYWLDGTNAGTRINTLYEVPNFKFALPIVPGGAELATVTQRWPTVADRTVRVIYDMTGGVDLPALVEIDVETHGVMAARMRTPASEKSPMKILDHATNYLDDIVDAVYYDASYSYDEDSGTGRLKAKGMVFEPFAFDRNIASHAVNAATTGWSFAPDRARAAWRDIPFQVGGPYTVAYEASYLLPDGRKVETTGTPALDEIAAGTRFRRESTQEDGRFVIKDFASYIPSEIAPSDIADQKAAMRRLASGDPIIRVTDGTRLWEIPDGDLMTRLQPHLDGVRALANLFPDEPAMEALRAALLRSGRDYEAALVAIDEALEMETTADALAMRVALLKEMGRYDEAVATAEEAYELSGDLASAGQLADSYALVGRAGEGLDLLDSMGLSGDDAHTVAVLWGEYAGDAGRLEEGWARLADAVAERPGEANLLNSQCWFAGTWNYEAETNLETCDKAVRESDYSAASLDSRALVYHRLGRDADALKDLEAALRKAPGQAASLYLRGLIRLKAGDQAGKSDIEHALRMDPSTARTYQRYGLAAAR